MHGPMTSCGSGKHISGVTALTSCSNVNDQDDLHSCFDLAVKVPFNCVGVSVRNG